MCGSAKAVVRGKLIVTNAYTGKEDFKSVTSAFTLRN